MQVTQKSLEYPFKALSSRKTTCFNSSVISTVVFAAGPHHGDGAGGGQRSEGPGHRGVRSRPALLQGTRPQGTLMAFTHGKLHIFLDPKVKGQGEKMDGFSW